jgi:hypothetical protein
LLLELSGVMARFQIGAFTAKFQEEKIRKTITV